MELITGMHRSGTSLVARLFFESGADLGDATSFHRPDKWNPDGYFEQPDIHAINMPLIHGAWGRLAYYRLPSTEMILKRAESCHEQIVTAAEKYDRKIVKETRFCLTLPAWLSHGAEVKRILVCLREPASVVRSLQRRNWITRGLGYRLWLAHVRRLIEQAGDIPLWYIRYENLLEPAAFGREMAAAMRFFDLDQDGQRLEALRRETVKPTWNHASRAGTTTPRPVQELWGRLLEQHAAQFGSTGS